MKKKAIALLEDSESDAFLFMRSLPDVNIFLYINYTDYLESKLDHDAVFSDIHLPDYDLYALHKAIQKESCPFYILSGIGDRDIEFIQTLKTMGVDKVFSKNNKDSFLKAITLAKESVR